LSEFIVVKVDRFGRVLIPRKIREALNLTADTEIESELRGRELVIRGRNFNLETAVDAWESSLRCCLPHAFIVKPTNKKSKLYTREYQRKLGL
jgi:transcriptional pleiotropic regulator of transition state genes